MAANTQPSQRQWQRGVPFPQPYYTFSEKDDAWVEATDSPPASSTTIDSFTVLSWNIDFRMILTRERMTAAVKYLHTYISNINNDDGHNVNIILLQEMLTSDLEILQSHPWIRAEYHLTDLTSEHWESKHYGTCVLIPKSLAIQSVFRVHYDRTTMQRDALFVDVDMSTTTTTHRPIRICCTHLESLVADPPLRPAQLTQAARFMHDPAVHAGVLGGDLNAIQDFDETLHANNGLSDAYLAGGGREGDAQGMTWGQMAPTVEREKFGLARMDKLLFCGGVEVRAFERFGMDVLVEAEEDRDRLVRQGLEKGWVTDHLGVKARFRVVDLDREVTETRDMGRCGGGGLETQL